MVVQSALLAARRAWRPSGTDTGPIPRGGENPDYAVLGAGSEGLPTPLRVADAKLFDSSHTEAGLRLCRGPTFCARRPLHPFRPMAWRDGTLEQVQRLGNTRRRNLGLTETRLSGLKPG